MHNQDHRITLEDIILNVNTNIEFIQKMSTEQRYLDKLNRNDEENIMFLLKAVLLILQRSRQLQTAASQVLDGSPESQPEEISHPTQT